jgi:hypothetical protein
MNRTMYFLVRKGLYLVNVPSFASLLHQSNFSYEGRKASKDYGKNTTDTMVGQPLKVNFKIQSIKKTRRKTGFNKCLSIC